MVKKSIEQWSGQTTGRKESLIPSLTVKSRSVRLSPPLSLTQTHHTFRQHTIHSPYIHVHSGNSPSLPAGLSKAQHCQRNHTLRSCALFLRLLPFSFCKTRSASHSSSLPRYIIRDTQGI